MFEPPHANEETSIFILLLPYLHRRQVAVPVRVEHALPELAHVVPGDAVGSRIAFRDEPGDEGVEGPQPRRGVAAGERSAKGRLAVSAGSVFAVARRSSSSGGQRLERGLEWASGLDLFTPVLAAAVRKVERRHG